MSLQFSRRALLRLTAVGLALVATGLFSLRMFRRDFIVSILSERLGDLDVETGAFAAFAAALRAWLPENDRKQIALIEQRSPFQGISHLNALQEQICSLFLLSSDLFVHNGTQPIRFVTLYDPYQRACTNPFAKR